MIEEIQSNRHDFSAPTELLKLSFYTSIAEIEFALKKVIEGVYGSDDRDSINETVEKYINGLIGPESNIFDLLKESYDENRLFIAGQNEDFIGFLKKMMLEGRIKTKNDVSDFMEALNNLEDRLNMILTLPSFHKELSEMTTLEKKINTEVPQSRKFVQKIKDFYESSLREEPNMGSFEETLTRLKKELDRKVSSLKFPTSGVGSFVKKVFTGSLLKSLFFPPENRTIVAENRIEAKNNTGISSSNISIK